MFDSSRHADQSLKDALQTHELAFDNAIAPADTDVDGKIKILKAYIETNHEGGHKLFTKGTEITTAVKNYITTDPMFKNVKEKLAAIHTFKSSSEAAITRAERAAVQSSTNTTRIAGDGNFESPLAKSVCKYFKDATGLADPWLSNSVNVKLSVIADFVANGDPVVISADAGAKVAKSIRDLEFFQELEKLGPSI